MYRVLDRLAEDKEAIVKHLNREISSRLNRTVSAAFYDVTTYAFESRKEGELRQFGLSKDHKVNEVQVVLGLVMDAFGIPIDYELFPGSTSEFPFNFSITGVTEEDPPTTTLPFAPFDL